MNIRSFDTITVCGQKGCGKTTLARYLLPMYKRVFVFDPNGEFPEYPNYEPSSDNPMELDKVAKVIWNEWNCMLLVSEAELFMPVTKRLPPNVFKIITRGRHRNVGLIADTRRIADLNKTCFGLSEWCFIFRHFSPNDIGYLEKFVPANCKDLRGLPDYNFWIYHQNKVTVHQPIPMPRATDGLRKQQRKSTS